MCSRDVCVCVGVDLDDRGDVKHMVYRLTILCICLYCVVSCEKGHLRYLLFETMIETAGLTING